MLPKARCQVGLLSLSVITLDYNTSWKPVAKVNADRLMHKYEAIDAETSVSRWCN